MPDSWKTFINDLYDLLSTYEFQKFPKKYDVQDINNWGKNEKPNGLHIKERNLPDFFNILQNQYDIDVSKLDAQKIKNDFKKLAQINEIIRQTLRHNHYYSYVCENNKLKISGQYIILENIDLNKSCSENFVFKSVEIIATNTIFIDRDFIHDESDFTLSLIAPKWKIIGHRIIKLEGKIGVDFLPAKAEIGQNGSPGFPGKNGGNFLGIVQHITNPENLTISVKGGKGGKGQDGGDGKNGKDGAKASTSNFDNLKHEKIGTTRWRIHGEKGEKGGDGGHGGVGGFGGNPGQLNLYHLEEGRIKIEKMQGSMGENGIGGNGGLGGSNGDDIEATFVICCWSSIDEIHQEEKGPEGNKGKDGFNTKSRNKPEDASQTDFRTKISDSKATFRNFLSSQKYGKEIIIEFLTKLDTNLEIINYLGFEGIINDYEVLENQLYGNFHFKEYIPFYKNLLTAVETEAKKLESSKEDEKIVLFHLYTSILSKINIDVDDLTQTNLVVNTKEYLGILKKTFKNYKDNGPDLVLYKKVTKKYIDDLIEETLEFNEKYVGETHVMGNILNKLGNLALRINNLLARNNQIKKFLNLNKSSEIHIPTDEILLVKQVLHEMKSSKFDNNNVANIINQMIPEIQNDIDDFEKSSISNLDVAKWQIPKKLRNIKYYIKQLPKEETSNGLEVLNHMIDIYKRVESYCSHKTLQDYIEQLASQKWTEKLTNKKYSPVITKLKETSIGNLIISQYENNLNTIKQISFPYFEEKLKYYRHASRVLNYHNLTDLLDTCISNTESVRGSVTDSPYRFAEYSWSTNFLDYRSPLAVWRNDKNRELLKKLFSGEKILLKPDVFSNKNYAVKFAQIDIHFKAVNKSYQAEINRILKPFHIELTHSGNSYYRCGNKSYVVTTPPLYFFYLIEKNKKGERIHQNAVYEKITQNDRILSPYTTWTLKLEPFDKNNHGLQELHNFHELVHLKLVGGYSYVEPNELLCDVNIDEYYELEEPFIDGSINRNRRYVEDYATSRASMLISSPINSFFNLAATISKIDYLESFASKSLEVLPNIFTSPPYFYDQINSLLILAPVLLCFTKNYFQQLSWKETHDDAIETSRIHIWKKFVKKFKTILIKHNVKLTWLLFNLEDRSEEISTCKSKKEADELEFRLVCLLVDFLDDVQYNESLLRVKVDENFISDVDTLIDTAAKIPTFIKNLKMM